MINKMYTVNRLVSLTEMILYLDKLIVSGFCGNRHNSGLALYLKMFVLVTTISVCQISCFYQKVHNSAAHRMT